MSDVIAASSVAVKTMADGTLRIWVDVEPRHSRDAFGLFGSPGTPMALAALKTPGQIDDETPAEPPESQRCEIPTFEEPQQEPAKGGPLAKWAALRCQDFQFREFFRQPSEESMRKQILLYCGTNSRAELDSNAGAAGLFRRFFMEPWRDHCERMGVGV